MPSTTRTGLGHLRSAAVSRSAWAGAVRLPRRAATCPLSQATSALAPQAMASSHGLSHAADPAGKHLVSGQRPHAERTESGPGQPAERAANRAAHGELGQDRAADLAAAGADGAQQREPAPAQVHRQRGGARQHEQGDQHDRDDDRPGQTLAVGPLDRGVQVRYVAAGCAGRDRVALAAVQGGADPAGEDIRGDAGLGGHRDKVHVPGRTVPSGKPDSPVARPAPGTSARRCASVAGTPR